MSDDQKPTYGKTPEGYEPEIVSQMMAMMGGQHNGQANEVATIARIYGDWKWQLKMRNHTHQEIADALQTCIERCKLELKDTPMRAQAIKRFETMKKRIEEFITTPDLDQLCPKCQLARFICPCPKE